MSGVGQVISVGVRIIKIMYNEVQKKKYIFYDIIQFQ